jgi:hypothetical protein
VTLEVGRGGVAVEEGRRHHVRVRRRVVMVGLLRLGVSLVDSALIGRDRLAHGDVPIARRFAVPLFFF